MFFMLALALLLTIQVVPPDGGAFLQPQIAASQKRVGITFGSAGKIYFAGSVDAGKSFGKPQKVADLPGLMLGRHRGPRIAMLGDMIVISAISNVTGDLVAWRSKDGGMTWIRGAAANATPGGAKEGLHAMIALPDGTLYAAWLDSQGNGKQLVGAASKDAGATWSKNVVIYESPERTICQCCHPSLAAGQDGSVHAMWRNALGGDRDMYTAVSRDHGMSFGPAVKLGTGSWPLQACPMDGGGIAVRGDGRPVAVWRRKQEIFLTVQGEPEKPLGTGKDATLASGPGGLYVAWQAPQGVVLRRPGRSTEVVLDAEGSYPQLLAIPGGPVLAAWERKGELQVQAVGSK